MKIFFTALIFTFLCASVNSAQTPTPTPKPAADDDDVVKISTTLIQLDVTVTDRKGNVVTDLKPEDFEIFENGEKQEISNFSFVSNVKTETAAPAQIKNEKQTVPLPPAQLKPEQIRRTVALVVDDLSLSFQSVYYVRRALKKFVDEQMQAGDLVAIIRTGAGIGALQQFTADKRQLYAAIEKIRWNPQGAGNIGAFAPIQSSATEQDSAENSEDETESSASGETELNNLRESIFATGTLGAVNYIVRGMQELPGRKSVMLMSDGFKLFEKSESGFVESSRVLDSLRQLVDLANRSSVVIYTMDARGLQTLGITAEDDVGGLSAERIEQKISDRRNQLSDTQEGLIYLARQTGGLSIVNNNDLSRGIERMLNDQSYYLVGYQPDTETFDPKTRRFNKLVVKVKRPNLTVRYRSGFFGVSDEQRAKPANQNPYQQINNALTSPFAVNDISLRLNTLFGNDAKQGTFVRSLIHVNAKDLKFSDEPDGNKKAVFDVLAMSFGDNGNPVDQISKSYTLRVKGESYKKILDDGFVYHFTFPVKKAGAYQYRVAIRDSQTEKLGSANQFIEVPNLKKNRLTLSGIVLENLTFEQWHKLSIQAQTAASEKPEAATDSMTATSLRKFKRGTVLRYGFEVYNAKLDAAKKPNLNVQIRLFRDGKMIFEGKQTALELLGQKDLERIKTVGALSLGTTMQAGDYILQIVVTDNLAKEKNKIAAQFVQFEVVE